MAAEHHADTAALKTIARQHQKGTRSSDNGWEKAKHRDPFMWPYINQEDLSKPKTLLLLLNARGRHDPCDFAAADSDAFRLGNSSNAIVPICVYQSTMILNGATGPDEYGKLLAWHEHPQAHNWLRSEKQFEPGDGFSVLEAQEGLLSFLVDCCKHILHDIAEESLTSNAFPIQKEPQLKTEAEATGFDSLAVMVAEEPYRVPAHLDLERIEALLAARTEAAEDHLWSLREDPGYFTEALWDVSEHRIEVLKDEARKSHPALDQSDKNFFWGCVAGEVLFNGYYELKIFSELHKQAQELRALQLKYAADISSMEDLPTEYLRAILKFRHFLDRSTVAPVTFFRGYIKFSPSFRHLHFLEIVDDNPAAEVCIKERQVKKTKFEKELLWLVGNLWEEGGQMYSTMRMPVVLDDLERLFDSEPKSKDLVLPCIAGVIGDLSILSHCYKQLERYQPWARGFDKLMQEYMAGIMKEIKAQRQPWNSAQSVELQTFKDGAIMSQALKAGGISAGKLAYPIDKRRTKENVKVLRNSEKSLDAFWDFLNQVVQTKGGMPGDPVVSGMQSQSRTMHRTPGWVEPIPEPKKTQTSQTTDRNVEALYKPLSALQFGLDTNKADGPGENPTKTKVKTKGNAITPPATAADVPPEDPTPSNPQPSIPVDARALKVFRTIFHNPSAAAPQGEIPWQDFLHAMASIGFAAEKLYGSVWQFRPVSLGVSRNIQFHEPHPRGKIPFLIARRIGRRLSRAYGWDLDMFTLKGK